ncbi:MAG TPA: alpha/beta hydrolase [Chroococcales cyanobacterium]
MTSTGVKLHGWLFRGKDSRTILVCHGNSGNILDLYRLIAYLRQTGCSVFVFDYQGFGRSQGAPSMAGICQDAKAAYDYVAKFTPADQIILYGESLGGGVACHIAQTEPTGGLILQSTFADIRTISYQVFLPLGIYPELLYPKPFFNSLKMLSKYERPVLFIHGEKDKDVSIKHAELMFAAASEPKLFVRLANTGHEEIDDLDGEQFVEALSRFLEPIRSQTAAVQEAV